MKHYRKKLIALLPIVPAALALGALVRPVHAASFPDIVDAAVARGRAWLLTELKGGNFPHGNFPMGIRSLYLYALLKAGANAQEGAVRGTLAYVEELPPEQTYSVALHLMALDQWARARASVKLLRLGQDLRDLNFLGEKKGRAERLIAWLLEAKARDRAHWTYTRAGRDGAHDYSNSQFAVLGIEIGLRNSLSMPPQVFESIGETFVAGMAPLRDRSVERVTITFRKFTGFRSKTDVGSVRTFQITPNGWGYTANSQPTFSMTCAGLANLAVARWGLERRDLWKGAGARRIEEAMHAAMAWIAVHWDALARMRSGPRVAAQNYYYTAYSLEKAGDLADVARFGSHDWYREEAEFLLRDQYEDGHWGRDGWEGVATSFALLFLSRATARFHPLNEVVVTGAGSDRDRDEELVYVEKLGGRVPIGTLLYATLQDDEPEVIRTAQEAVDRFLPADKGLLVPTLLVLGQSGPQRTQAFALKALRAITGMATQDPEAFAAWCTTWEEIRAIERARDRGKVERLVAIARSGPWDSLRVRALEAIERFGAIESVGDIIPLLEDKSAEVRERVRAFVRFFSGGAIDMPAGARESDIRQGRERAEAWFRQAGAEIIRKRKVEAALAAFLAPEPPAYAEHALAGLRECPVEAVTALLERLRGSVVEYRIFVALRAVTGEDRGLDPEAWRQGRQKGP
jgi:hypothetical protein